MSLPLTTCTTAPRRYFLREMVGVIKLKKYREMKKRYGQEEKKFDDIVRASRGLEEEWRGKLEEQKR